jgi:hypothetical protein
MSRKKALAQEKEFSKSSEVLDISQLSKQVIENSDKVTILKLQEQCDGLSKTIDLLLKQSEQKEEEIAHLKQILSKSIPVEGEVIKIDPSDEEIIAEIQLRKIREISRTRDLTLDEVKRFDLLVKNKRLAKGDATVIETNKLPTNLSKNDLIKIATRNKDK